MAATAERGGLVGHSFTTSIDKEFASMPTIYWSKFATTAEALDERNRAKTMISSPRGTPRDEQGNPIHHSFQGYVEQAISIANSSLEGVHISRKDTGEARWLVVNTRPVSYVESMGKEWATFLGIPLEVSHTTAIPN